MPKEFLIGVDDDCRLQFIHDDELIFLGDLGQVETTRASHVEPADPTLRKIFHMLRCHFGEDSPTAEWTRSWDCLWQVDMRPSNGPVLTGRWRNRLEALQAEVEWLQDNVL